MPQHFALSTRYNKHAIIKADGSLEWGSAKNATVFHSDQDARDQVIAAMKKTLAQAKATYKEAVAIGPIQKRNRKGVIEHFVPHFGSALPQWITELVRGDGPSCSLKLKEARLYFHIDSKMLANDIVGSFETFYGKSLDGWLGSTSKGFCWCKSFSDAHGFTSESSLIEAIELADITPDFYTILRSRSAFTQTKTFGRGFDAVVSHIQAACEARDLDTTISEAANERIAAVEASTQQNKKTNKQRL